MSHLVDAGTCGGSPAVITSATRAHEPVKHTLTRRQSQHHDRAVPPNTTWYCVRRDGTPRRSGWMANVALNHLPRRVRARGGDTVEVCIADEFREVPLDRFSRVFRKRDAGELGMELSYRGDVLRIAPTRMIATNRSFARALDRFLGERNTNRDDFGTVGALRAFSARQFLLSDDGDEVQVAELRRGTTVVPATPGIDEDRTGRLATGIGGWMLRNLTAEGRLPYKYRPSRGEESPADNAIRRFLASLSLARLGALRGSADLQEAARRNLRFNLALYFRNIGGGRGAIVERTGAKLGAAALAALCILESPAQEEFLTELTMLAAGVSSLADAELGFRTFFFPPERAGDNWNFYSGEALLFWTEALRRGAPGAPSLERCTAAFTRCRDRHRQARNPAFVPWHTQACASLFEQTGRREFADFTFEASDWLLPMQQWEGVPPDLQGRFYDPQRPHFGPPHAASTGVYLEGLADALKVARTVGDAARTAAYERAIGRGLRSLRQLQFRRPRDAFYVARKKRVLGALRTEAYDNTVRVDSAAHALAAAVKVLRLGSQWAGST